MQLTFEQGEQIFVLSGTTPQTKDVPKDAGFRWNRERRVWWTSDEVKARQLAHLAKNGLRQRWGMAPDPDATLEMSFDGADEEKTNAVAAVVVGTPQQEAFWDAATASDDHLVLMARAGCGKTFSICEAGRRAVESNPALRVGFASFNSHITEELRAKAPKGVTVQSLHALGYAAVQKAATGKVELDKDGAKVAQIVNELWIREHNIKPDLHTIGLIRKIVSLCKGYLFEGTTPQIEGIIKRHAIEIEPSAKELKRETAGAAPRKADGKLMSVVEWTDALRLVYRERVFGSIAPTLDGCRAMLNWIDFDDQIWLPVVVGMAVAEFDLLMVDESQDMNPCQQQLSRMACPNGRIVVVGDDRQAIYAFRGADARSMETMREALEQSGRQVRELPLTQTRRCPRAVVKLAREIVPDFEAMDGAPDGEVLSIDIEEVAARAVVGDMVLCRTNAPLVGLAHQLIRAGKRPDLRGRDLSRKIREMINRMDDKEAPGGQLDVPHLSKALQNHRDGETYRLTIAGKSADVITAVQDECDTVLTLLEGLETRAALDARIDAIFKPRSKEPGVILTTVHGAKGSEADTVFLLHPYLMPHPNAKSAEDLVQEWNCRYVALTRAKKTLIFAVDEEMAEKAKAMGARSESAPAVAATPPVAPPVAVEIEKTPNPISEKLDAILSPRTDWRDDVPAMLDQAESRVPFDEHDVLEAFEALRTAINRARRG